MTQKHQEILQKIEQVKESPGIYLWKDINGEIIYIGKAKKLKKRMKQYFTGSLNSYKTSKMFEQIADYEVIYTLNERDALHLEERMIKENTPKYNIKLVYSSKSPYIKVFIDSKNLIKFGFSEKVSKKHNSENEFYYGPLFYNDEHKNFIDVLKSFYTYKEGILITKQSYREAKIIFDEIIEIFKFKNNDFVNKLYDEELRFASLFEFDNAIKYQKAQEFLRKTKEPQVTEIEKIFKVDYIVFKQINNIALVGVKSYNYGITTNFFIKYFYWNGLLEEFIENFLDTFYKDKILPKQIFINETSVQYINEINTQFKSLISIAKIGTNANILKNIELNLDEKYKSLSNDKGESIFKEISQKLGIEVNNLYIFDNSFEKNKDGVGAVLEINQFNYNKPILHKWNLEKEIANFEKENDLKYMYFNVLKFLKLYEASVKENDVFVADGAINQIKEIQEALKNYGFKNKIIGLVKNDFHKTQKVIDENNNTLSFSQTTFKFFESAQFKVDKRAKEYLNKRRIDKLLNSEVLNIPGVGEKTELKLIKKFQTFDNLKKATLSELEQVVSKKQAKEIYNFYNNDKDNKS
ncbi:GIY-YIG nuclease family protein [Mycoplasmopsis edwardii]|nr:GIY-YIG nuclease family protein [Mycoplasmopsis edwardii]